MTLNETMIFWIGGLILLGVAAPLVAAYFSPGARERRKRQKNYNPIVSRAKRPMVTFRVRVKKP
jgi:hypothetical protein